jgi:hypothetical protein
MTNETQTDKIVNTYDKIMNAFFCVLVLALSVGAFYLHITRHDRCEEARTSTEFLPPLKTILAAASGCF